MHLQKSVQADLQGWLESSLFRYIFCRDQKSRDCLREEIMSVGDFANFDPGLVWARYMVLRALSPSENEAHALLEKAKGSLESLSQSMVDWMKGNGLITSNLKRIENRPAEESPISRKQTEAPKREHLKEDADDPEALIHSFNVYAEHIDVPGAKGIDDTTSIPPIYEDASDHEVAKPSTEKGDVEKGISPTPGIEPDQVFLTRRTTYAESVSSTDELYN